jgi:hypothetical protein
MSLHSVKPVASVFTLHIKTSEKILSLVGVVHTMCKIRAGHFGKNALAGILFSKMPQHHFLPCFPLICSRYPWKKVKKLKRSTEIHQFFLSPATSSSWAATLHKKFIKLAYKYADTKGLFRYKRKFHDFSADTIWGLLRASPPTAVKWPVHLL